MALPRDPQPWLIEKIVPAGGLMNVYGKPKLGKSFMALGIALAVSNPAVTQWLDRPVLKHGPVVYLQVDTPRSEWADRVSRISEQHDISNIHFTDMLEVPYPLNINVEGVKLGLKQYIAQMDPKPVLLVVDTLREVHEGDENDSGAMKKVITSLVECTMGVNCSLLLVSHSRKDNIDRPDDIMDDGRGSSYVSGRMDVVAKLTEKNVHMKGRSIGATKVAVQQDNTGLIVQNAEKADMEASLKMCLEQPVSDRERAKLLMALVPGLELEAARSRIRDYKAKHKL